MKRPDLDPETVAWTLGGLAVAGAIVGAAVVFLGLYNVSARVGHFPGVGPVLHTTFRNSVDLRAMSVDDVPELTDEMAALGAKHFDAACADCHSAPGRGRTATMRAMSPLPPHITQAVGHWNPAELHWIVREGVKMSGMPHWPADRDEEVWPVVAFLTRVQEGMDGAAYTEMTGMEKTAARDFAYCTSCHGERGATDNPHIPRLDILSRTYMTEALSAYRRGARDSGIMEHAATEVTPAALAEYAERFAGFAPEGGSVNGADGDLVTRGRALSRAEDSTRVPACAACHGPWPDQLDEAFPSLAGQNQSYLGQQLTLWRDGQRGGGRVRELMHLAAEELTDADIEALAAYYASLAPATLNETAEAE
ncbi:cytochrome c, class I [Roseivivax marinus]|uniref:Cytochrome c, class I n=1 Tax=Roseivivax marinus TaxID=1379903 RepID=W4HKK2_9RHOB|nr:c-type cytochrome [Roseivivax marinus]ETW13259.1 cytochrome c, class I [Roseivivax marinus]